MRQNLAGSDVTRALLKSLNERKLPGLAKNDLMEANTIKEKVCYVSADPPSEKQLYEDDAGSMGRNYELPDATTITVTHDRYECPEILFQPQLSGNEDALGLHELCLSSICKVDTEELRLGMFENIVLSGGSSVFPGFNERMTREITVNATDG